MIRKPLKVRSKAIRNAARGEACTLRLVGVCNGDWETTVLAHVNAGGHGMGTKESDISACFACSSCHDVLDGRVQHIVGDDEKLRAVIKTLHRLIEKGIIEVKGFSYDQ